MSTAPVGAGRRPAGTAARYVALLAYLVFLGFPLVWLAVTALRSASDIAVGGLLPTSPTLANFGSAVRSAGLLRATANSAQVAVATTAVVVVISLPAAYALARFRTRVRTAAIGWILVSQVFPVILVVLPLFLILRQFHLVNSLIGLTVVYAVYSLPFALWMLQGYIAGVPRDLEEAGAVDGAGRLSVLLLIVLPILRPGIVAAAMFTLISSWNEFFFALVLIQDPHRQTLPLALARFVGAEGQVQLGVLAAASLLATIPSLAFFAVIQRRLTSGLLSGAVKG